MDSLSFKLIKESYQNLAYKLILINLCVWINVYVHPTVSEKSQLNFLIMGALSTAINMS